jgi:hypothetical protein
MPFQRHVAYLLSAGAFSASTHQECQLTIRIVCASTITAIGLACTWTAFARVTVQVPVAVVYGPPPRPVYYSVPDRPPASRTYAERSTKDWVTVPSAALQGFGAVHGAD